MLCYTAKGLKLSGEDRSLEERNPRNYVMDLNSQVVMPVITDGVHGMCLEIN